MKAAGIPVLGELLFKGVTHGKLTTYVEGDEIVYTWEAK